jgi:hypothetical protein
MSKEEIKAEIVKALQMGENHYTKIYHYLYDYGVNLHDFQIALYELIDCDRITDLEDGYLHLNY